MKIDDSLARRIRRLRVNRHMTVAILAAQCDVSVRDIRDLEAGRVTDPDLTLGMRLAQILRVDPEYLALGQDAVRILREVSSHAANWREAKVKRKLKRNEPVCSAHSCVPPDGRSAGPPHRQP